MNTLLNESALIADEAEQSEEDIDSEEDTKKPIRRQNQGRGAEGNSRPARRNTETIDLESRPEETKPKAASRHQSKKDGGQKRQEEKM